MPFIKNYIKEKKNLSKKNSMGNPPLHLSILFKRIDMIELLIEAGVDLEQKNDNEHEALLYH